MLIMGAITLLYAFFYCTGSLAELGQVIDTINHVSDFTASPGKYDALFYNDIQGFNNVLMWFGLIMVILAVTLFITASHKRRNYYISNYVAIGVCAGGNFIISLIAMIMNASWRAAFLNVDFEAWYQSEMDFSGGDPNLMHYGDSTIWFDIGFVVYILMMVVAVLLILNLLWKIKLMKGERKLLDGNMVGGVA